MIWTLDETIVAPASAVGLGARAILRVSGPRSLSDLAGCFSAADGRRLTELNRPTVVAGQLRVRTLRSSLDVQAYVWPGTASFTRQPMVELHLIGSPPLVEAVVEGLVEEGLRLAQPGEFTLRAFLAGRIDLTQAEAVLGVVSAQDRRSLQVALAQLAGGVSQPLQQLRANLLDLLARVEAGLDFVEEDIEFISKAEMAVLLQESLDSVAAAHAQLDSRGLSGARPCVVLLGHPNAGKSSLFNRLAGERALVAEVPGTTRDYLSGLVELGGMSIELIDTAGVAEGPSAALAERDGATATTVAHAAQRQTQSRRAAADLLVYCLDGSIEWSQAELSALARPSDGESMLVVVTKSDLPRRVELHNNWVAVSTHSGQGIEPLKLALAAALHDARSTERSVVPTTAVRCEASLARAAEALARGCEVHRQSAGEELLAAEIRAALDALGEVVGAVYSDEILDGIFSRFCIGK